MKTGHDDGIYIVVVLLVEAKIFLEFHYVKYFRGVKVKPITSQVGFGSFRYKAKSVG